MGRRTFFRQVVWVGGGVVVLAWLLEPVHAHAEAVKPNFLVILCDDLGYGDIACFGSTVIKTPCIDKLASEGMRLTSCYASAPVCSPSRCGLLTGRTPNRLGIYDSMANPFRESSRSTGSTIARWVGPRWRCATATGRSWPTRI